MYKNFDSEDFRNHLASQHGSYESVFFTGETQGEEIKLELTVNNICKEHNSTLGANSKEWRTLSMQLEDAGYDLRNLSIEEREEASSIFAEEARGE